MKKLLLLLPLLGCGPTAPPRQISTDATCESACINLQRMHCEAGQDSDGTSCTELCLELVDYGVDYPVGCVSAASSCDEADACSTS